MPKNIKQQIPKHVAIIMDGNGRWAQKRFLPRISGHKAGAKSLKMAIEHSLKLGIDTLTVFAFGRENWCRPISEVNGLMNLFAENLVNETPSLIKNSIQLRVIGDKSRLSNNIICKIQDAESKTSSCEKMKLNIALDYSGRWEISEAAKSIAFDIKDNKIIPEDICEETLEKYISFRGLSNVDLLIRTSGEQRISNFMLWQIAYTELHFSNKLWPNFTQNDFDEAIKDYQSRIRKFGNISI